MADTPLFLVACTCCGRDAGFYGPFAWDEADACREAYLSGPGVNDEGGHVRSAIIVDAPRIAEALEVPR